MQRIGIIGVGEIGRAIVEGLCEGGGDAPEVFLSPRSADIAAELAARYPSVLVCESNQEVVERSDVIVIALRAKDRHEALTGLRVGAEKVLINVIAGVPDDELRRLLGTEAAMARAIPLPTVRERRSLTVVYPSHPVVDAFFERLGGAQPLPDEASFDVCSTLSGTLTAHYAFLSSLTAWAAAQGMPEDVADRYVRSLFQGVGRTLGDPTRTLERLAADHETPGGSNERLRTTWLDPANLDALHKALDGLLAHLRD